MKHTLPLVIYLSLLLSLLTGTRAHGQYAQRPMLSTNETITTDVALASPVQLLEVTTVTVGQLSASVTSQRAEHRAHVSFQIRFGRAFSITVTKS